VDKFKWRHLTEIYELGEIEQILGKALGYPFYKDDPKNFPGATEETGVCVGELAPIDLADQAAKEIKRLRGELEEKKQEILKSVEGEKELIQELMGIRIRFTHLEYMAEELKKEAEKDRIYVYKLIRELRGTEEESTPR
jgi:hypothetical protein